MFKTVTRKLFCLLTNSTIGPDNAPRLPLELMAYGSL